MQTDNCSINELATQVNAWCTQNRVHPLHNRVGAEVTVRNIRYYQTLGLVDRPSGPHGLGFTEKHRLQLIAIRLLQAKGLPLERIQSLLYGRSVDDLREIERRGLAEMELQPAQMPAPSGWKVIPLGENYLLLSRMGREPPPGQKQRILEILNGASEREPQGAGAGVSANGAEQAQGQDAMQSEINPPEEEDTGFRPEFD